MYKKQIIVVVIVLAIMGYLYTQPVKGLIRPSAQPQGHVNAAPQAARPVANVSVDIVSAAAKILVGPALAAQINTLEDGLKSSQTDAQSLIMQKKLASLWDDTNQPAPAAFYYQDIAKKENTFKAWLTAGDHFNDAFKTFTDSTAKPAFVLDAIACLKNAVKLQPQSLDGKTALGIAYVNQTSLGMADAEGGSPMQGIMLLLDVVKQEPDNINANLNLGLFAINSGQYQKAVQRFKTVIAKKPTADAYFYIAEAYKQLGMKPEAIAAYQKCREMVPDAAFDKRIDDFIKELKN